MNRTIRLAFFFGLGLVPLGFAGPIYAPAGNQNVEGNNAFQLAPSGVGEQLLELVLSSNFSGPVQITGFDLRLDASSECPTCSPFSTTLSNFTVEVATTSMSNTSDNTYADYLTTNEQTVINGSLAVSSSDTGPAGGPTAFDIHFPFSSPYSYNPSSGNLVIWLAIANQTSGIPSNETMDAEMGSSVYRIFGGYFQGGIGSCNCVYQPTGIGDNNGWVLQINTAAAGGGGGPAVPEPATVWLAAPAGLALIGVRLRRRAAR